jgi:hypothetical protein
MNRFKTWVQFFLLFLRNFILAAWGIISSSLGKSVLWFILTLFFGLLQSWIILMESYVFNMDNNIYIGLKFEKLLIMSGALLFFSTAIIASLTIDYFLLRGVSYSKSRTGLLFVLFPVIALILCISLFSMFHGKCATDINYEFVRAMEYVILTATFIYAVVVKIMLNLNLEQQDEGHQ